MRTVKEIKKRGIIEYVFCCRQLNENIPSRKGMIAPALKTVLTVLPFFVLIVFNFSEAQVPNEHKTCTVCHIEEDSSTLKAGINETCIGCHPSSPGRDHPIGIVIEDVSEKLPLDRENKITCVTCHEPHGKGTEGRLLRVEFNDLCILCHKN